MDIQRWKWATIANIELLQDTVDLAFCYNLTQSEKWGLEIPSVHVVTTIRKKKKKKEARRSLDQGLSQ